MENIMSTEIWQGKTIADVLTLDFLATVAGSVLGAIAILFLGWVISSWLQRRIAKIGRRHEHLDNMLFDFFSSVVRYAVMAFTVVFVLNTFGIQTTSIVAVLGAAGLAIGLALQGTLSNVAAGVMLIIFRPIKIDDFVKVGDKMGTVKKISLNFTEIADLTNAQVIVPNSDVWGNTITNFTTNDTRRVEWTFGVGYGVNLKQAEDAILNEIMADDRAHSDPAPFIQVANLGGSSVDFMVRVWCNSTDYFEFKNDMNRKVKEALDREGIDIPFPTRTLLQAAG